MKKIPLSEKQRKEKLVEANDILDAIGQESEKKGISETKYFMDQWDRRQWHENQLKKDRLDSSRKFRKMEYYRILAAMLQEEIADLDIPNGYMAWSEFTQSGVVVRLRDRWGKKYYRAFKPDGTPEIDFNAVVGLLTDVQNSVDKLEYDARENLKQSGFILPS
jgi:hypothetical protein